MIGDLTRIRIVRPLEGRTDERTRRGRLRCLSLARRHTARGLNLLLHVLSAFTVETLLRISTARA